MTIKLYSMCRNIKLWVAILLLPVSLKGQLSLDSVMTEIERNNITLAAIKKNTEAEKIGNKTGIYLENPEIGLNYLWSDPSSLGNRTDLHITQSFDFPSAYRFRQNIADTRNVQADLEYQKEQKRIKLEARLLCIDIIYLNAMILESQVRVSHAQELADAYQSMFDSGQTGLLELNKVKLNLLNVAKELESLQIKRAAALKELAAMNGGIPLEITTQRLPDLIVPANFDEWYPKAEQANPILRWLDLSIQASHYQEKLNRSLSLPRSSAGYMSENRTGEQLHGITLGISIPVFENRNRVKYARVMTQAWQDELIGYKTMFYNDLRIQYDKAVLLQQTVNDYRETLNHYQNTALLKKALELGEISLLTYIMELTLTYSTTDKYLQAEHELNRAIALLFQYTDSYVSPYMDKAE